MLSTRTLKSNYPNFHLDGFLYVHRTMAKNLEDIAKTCRQLDTLTIDQIRQFRIWFEFVYVMIEHHHHEEESSNSEFGFPKITQTYPIENLEKLIVDHEVLAENMTDIKTKLNQLEVAKEKSERDSLIAALQKTSETAYREMVDHLTYEEEVIVPLVHKHFSKGEQQRIGIALQRQGMKATPKKYSIYGLPWFVSGLDESEKAAFLKELPLPPKLLMRFSWNKKYEQFSAVAK
jgi:hemerythrin-like domain-containing protein